MKLGNVDAIQRISHCYSEGKGATKDINEAIRLLKVAISHGNADAMCDLGAIYHAGMMSRRIPPRLCLSSRPRRPKITPLRW
jgi:TPR repeat protein